MNTAFIIRLWKTFLDVLFPPICINCRSFLKSDAEEIICRVCFENINIFGLCSPVGENIILAGAAPYDNSAVKELIHALKYDGFEKASVPLAELITIHAEKIGLMEIIEPENAVIVPIPLHRKRLKKRGFNQSELIAKEVGKRLGIEVVNVLKRVKDTKPQIKMKTAEERAENIKGAFALNTNYQLLTTKSLILLDDVYTSGATAREAVKVLRKLKPEKIIILTAAKTKQWLWS